MTYTVGLGVVGTLDPAVDFPALRDGTKQWSVPTSDSKNNVDDLWRAAINGHGRSILVQKIQNNLVIPLASALADIASRWRCCGRCNIQYLGFEYQTLYILVSTNWSRKTGVKRWAFGPALRFSVTNDWDTDNWKVTPASRNLLMPRPVVAVALKFGCESASAGSNSVTNATSFLTDCVTGT